MLIQLFGLFVMETLALDFIMVSSKTEGKYILTILHDLVAADLLDYSKNVHS